MVVRHRWLLPLAVALVTAVVFGRLVGCEFTDWDDPSFIRDNPRLRPPTAGHLWFYWTTVGERTPGQLYTPMAYTAWSAVAAVAGVRPGPFHAANVMLHAAAAAMACVLLRQLTGRPWAAAAGALLFAVHPVQVEPVAWASDLKDVLCGLLSIASLSAYVAGLGSRAADSPPPFAVVVGNVGTLTYAARRTVGRGRRRLLYVTATCLFVLAMAAKPTAIVVPVMAFTIDTLVMGRSRRRAAAALWPWAVLMIPCASIARAAQPAPWASPVPTWTRPLVAADAVAFYLGKVVWPAHLGADYGRRPVAVYASGSLYWTWLVPAAVAVVIAWRRRPVEIAAAVLFVLPLVPVSGLVPFDYQFYSTTADHYLYLPMVGVGLMLAAVVPGWRLRPPSVAAVAATPVSGVGVGLVVTALAVRTVTLEPAWHDTRSLFEHARAVNPQSFLSCYMLGGVVAVYEADPIRGDRPTVPPTDPRYDRWRAALERALDWYAAALDRCPDYVPALTNVAQYAGQLGDHRRQRAALRRVVALQPTLPAGLRADPDALAARLVDAGDPAAAAAYLDGLIRAHPDDARLLLLRAQVANGGGGSARP